MYGPLELKSLIDQRHEGALGEAQTRRLAKQARANAVLRSGWASAHVGWASVLACSDSCFISSASSLSCAIGSGAAGAGAGWAYCCGGGS